MLTFWDSFADLNRLHRDLEQRAFAPAPQPKSSAQAFAPAVDVYEEGEALVVAAELPGLTREEIEISLDHNVLTLKGERKRAPDATSVRTLRTERRYGGFVRHFQLPETVDAERIEAKLTDGVLTVRLPKKEAVKPRKIEVAGN